MSYVANVLRDRPYGFWSLDEEPFRDLSGNANAAISSGLSNSGTLVSGGGHSSVVSGNGSVVFPFPMIQWGYESRSWSWEFWFHPLGIGTDTPILEVGSVGVWFDGADLTFRMVFADDTNADVTYEIKQKEAYHVVVTHSANRNAIYINGELVSATPILTSQIAEGYDGGAVAVKSGGSDDFLLDSVAFYIQELSTAKIRRHFQAGRDVKPIEDVVLQGGGYYYEPSDAAADIYLSREWDSLADFASSPLYDCNVGESLTNKSTAASSWVMPINLGARDSKILVGMKASWVGEGSFVVEYTTDNSTWHALSNSQYVNLNNLDVANMIMDIRVTFGTGYGEVNYLTIKFYNTNSLNFNVRPVTVSGNVSLSQGTNQPIEGNITRGAGLSGGGALLVGADSTESPSNSKTIEVWASFDTSESFWVFDQRTTGATTRPYLRWTGTALESQGIGSLFIDGQPTTTWTPTPGSHLITAVLSATNNFATRFGAPYNGTGNNGYIQSVAFYQAQISQALALQMYNSYFGIVTNRIVDSSVVEVSEDDPAYTVVAYNWSIVASDG